VDHASAFVESIVECPDDDAPRLIFADWLDDAGQPERAEFIRLQVARAKLHPADPRVRASLRREAELLAHNEAAWLGPLAVLASRCRFHRGLVEEVTVTVQGFLRHGHEILRRAPVRRLQLRGTWELPSLMEDAKLAARLADLLGRIRVLDLNRAGLNEPAGLALLNLPKLPQLEGLHLAQNALTPAGVAVLAESPVLASLRTLEFNTGTSRENLEALLSSRHLRRLENLILTGTSQGDRAVALLHAAKSCARLRRLALGHANLTPNGVAELVAAPAAGSLEWLDLSFNRLGPEGLRHLAHSPRLGRLTWLNLSRTHLGDEGAAVLAGSALFARLRGVDLSLCRVGDPGGRALAKAPPAARPGTLDLIYNSVGAEVRDALARRFGEDVCLFTR
jgi:uncharacterized protein (TIGR02996 family)